MATPVTGDVHVSLTHNRTKFTVQSPYAETFTNHSRWISCLNRRSVNISRISRVTLTSKQLSWNDPSSTAVLPKPRLTICAVVELLKLLPQVKTLSIFGVFLDHCTLRNTDASHVCDTQTTFPLIQNYYTDKILFAEARGRGEANIDEEERDSDEGASPALLEEPPHHEQDNSGNHTGLPIPTPGILPMRFPSLRRWAVGVCQYNGPREPPRPLPRLTIPLHRLYVSFGATPVEIYRRRPLREDDRRTIWWNPVKRTQSLTVKGVCKETYRLVSQLVLREGPTLKTLALVFTDEEHGKLQSLTITMDVH